MLNPDPRCLLAQTESREDREEKAEMDRFLIDGDDEDEENSNDEFDEDKLDDMDDKIPPPEPVDEDELKGQRGFRLFILLHRRFL